MDGSRGLAEELIPLKPRPNAKNQVFDRTKVVYDLRTQTYGETHYLSVFIKFWTEPKYCMVLGLKPMGKPTTYYQNQVLDRTKVLYGPQTQTYGETNYLSIFIKF